MKQTKSFFAFLVLCALALVLAACSKVTSTESQATTANDTTAADVTTAEDVTTTKEDVTTTAEEVTTTEEEVTTTEEPTTEHVHEWSEYVSNNDATCTADGTKTRTCACGETETVTDEGSMLAHSYGDYVQTLAPYKGVAGKEVATCSVCGATDEREVADTTVYTNENWTTVGADQYAYSFGDAITNLNEEVMNNDNHYDVGHVNNLIYNAKPADFYKLSVKIKGTISSALESDGADVYSGVILDYVDENNYMAFIIRWTTWDRPSEIRSVYFISVVDGVYTSAGDNWTDGCSLLPNATMNLTVVKSLSLNGAIYTVTLSARGGDWTKTCSTTVADYNCGKVGLCGANDNFVYSNFSVEENADLVTTAAYTATVDEAVQILNLDYLNNTYILSSTEAILKTGTYTLEGKTVTLSEEGKDDVLVKLGDATFEYVEEDKYVAEYQLKAGESATIAENISGDYTMSFNFMGTKAAGFTEDDKVGAYVWYVDENNYLQAYVQWGVSRNDAEEVRQLSINGKFGGEFCGWSDGWTDGARVYPCDGGVVTVSKTGKSFTIVYTSGTYSKTWTRDFTDNSAMVDGTYSVKIYTSGLNLDFYNVGLTSNATLGIDCNKDFEIEFDTVGTIDASVTAEVLAGLKLTAGDADYINLFTAWQSWNRPEEIRNMYLTGKIGDAFAAGTEWNEAWCDGCGIHPAALIHHTIKKSGTTITYTIACGTYSKTLTVNVSNWDSTETWTAVVSTSGDSFLIRNLTCKNVETATE